MSYSTKDAIELAVQGNVQEFRTAVNDILMDKVREQIDLKKIEVASTFMSSEMVEEEVDLDEAKMEDSEVLKAAKALASNGKDEKTKSFGKGLVDFYEKNKSFTPDQVAGLQNIMKNAPFQLAKDED